MAATVSNPLTRTPLSGGEKNRIKGESDAVHQLTAKNDTDRLLMLRWDGEIGKFEVIAAYAIKFDVKGTHGNYEFRLEYTETPKPEVLKLAYDYGMTMVKRISENLSVYEFPPAFDQSVITSRPGGPYVLA